MHAFIYSVCEGLVLAPLIVMCELSNAAQAMEFDYIYSSVENLIVCTSAVYGLWVTVEFFGLRLAVVTYIRSRHALFPGLMAGQPPPQTTKVEKL